MVTLKDTFFHRIGKKSELERILENIPRFKTPKRALEQYITPGDLASEILWEAYISGDMEDKVVVDLGCGTGRLTIGSSLLRAKLVIGLDVDIDTLKDLLNVVKSMRLYSKIDLVQALIPYVPLRRADIVIQNPPFGIWRRGADLKFLISALSLAPKVYSIHKSNINSRKLLLREAMERGYVLLRMWTRYMRIPQMFEHHRRRSYRFKVDIYVFGRVKR